MNGTTWKDRAPLKLSLHPELDAIYALVDRFPESENSHWPYSKVEHIASFRVKVSVEQGFSAEFYEADRKHLGTISFPPSSTTCSAEGLTVVLRSGMAHDGPGAWTIGYEKITLQPSIANEGKLLVKQTQKRFDVFWFGLPVRSEYGMWLLFDPAD